MLDANDPVQVTHDRLTVRDVDAANALYRAIARAATTDVRSAQQASAYPSPSPMAGRRRQRPAAVGAADPQPARARRQGRGLHLDQRAHLAAVDAVAALYALTATEGRVLASILEGRNEPRPRPPRHRRQHRQDPYRPRFLQDRARSQAEPCSWPSGLPGGWHPALQAAALCDNDVSGSPHDVSAEEFSSVIDLIYDCAIDPAHWPNAIAAICKIASACRRHLRARCRHQPPQICLAVGNVTRAHARA